MDKKIETIEQLEEEIRAALAEGKKAKRARKSKFISAWQNVFGRHFFKCLLVALAVSLVIGKYAAKTIYFYEGKEVTRGVYEHYSKEDINKTLMSVQDFNYDSASLFGLATLVLAVIFSKINFKGLSE